MVHHGSGAVRALSRSDAAERPHRAERGDPERDRTDRQHLHRGDLRRRRVVPRVHARQGLELRHLPAGALRDPDLRQLGLTRGDDHVGWRGDLSPLDRGARRRRIRPARQRLAPARRVAVLPGLVPRAAIRRRRKENGIRAIPAGPVQRPAGAEGRRRGRPDARGAVDSGSAKEPVDDPGRSRTRGAAQHPRPPAAPDRGA